MPINGLSPVDSQETLKIIGNYQVLLKNLNGKTRPLHMDGPEDTVRALKAKVQELEGIAPDKQRLIYGGHQLEDDKTLGFYEIQRDSTVWLVLRLRGGFSNCTSDTSCN
jgi:ubiquitin C